MMSFHDFVPNVLRLIDRSADHVELVKQGNDVFRLVSGAEHFFLKTYTKDWYGPDPATTGFHVRHESAAWAILAKHGLPVPEVMYVSAECDNPLSRPFVLTRQLEGRPLTEWLSEANREEQSKLLATVGDYVRRMHAITFEFPGYLSDLSGPAGSPNPNDWQHRCWSAHAREAIARSQLEADAAQLTDATYAEGARACSQISARLAQALQPPRFTHGDCHAHQFFLVRQAGDWRVTGVLDMEVSSAGDSGEDLIKVCIELAQTLEYETGWWEALFAGYGTAPDFEAFRLCLLSVASVEYGSTGQWVQSTSREAMLQRILHAGDWSSLFAPIV